MGTALRRFSNGTRHFFSRLRSTQGIRCLCALSSVIFLVGCYDLNLSNYVDDGGGGAAGGAGGASGGGGTRTIGMDGGHDAPVASGGMGAGGTGGASGGATGTGGVPGSGGVAGTGGAAGSGGLSAPEVRLAPGARSTPEMLTPACQTLLSLSRMSPLEAQAAATKPAASLQVASRPREAPQAMGA